ncbi:DUF4843 domain-containing protein [Flavobacterium notoginsengisoli]|uniref:DUF4843 domain-containing protein n=1 Tax=Flavobacterium notoginsengisoli TaxID=1478199 RepID=UPI00362B2BA1
MDKILRKGLTVVLMLFAIVFTSCDQAELIEYNDNYDGIAFFIAGTAEADSLSYSFAYNTDELERDTIFIKMRLVGKLRDSDRTIKVVADQGTTATAGIHYELPDIVLPAGEGYVNYPLVLLNADDLKTTDYKIKLKIVATEDLKVGATGREIGTTTVINGSTSTSTTTINLDHYTVNFNNKLTEPDYWSSLVIYGYGSFSITKFQFMLKTLGSELMNGAADWSYNQTLNYRIKLINALGEYETANGPLLDENDEKVQFN